MEYLKAPLERLTDTVATLGKQFHALRRPRRRLVYIAGGGQTDANGDAVIRLYTVVAGSHFCLHRLVLEREGSDPDSPIATGYAAVIAAQSDPDVGQGYPAGSLRDFAPRPEDTTAQVFPRVFAYAELAGHPFNNGESIYVVTDNVGASVPIAVTGYGWLYEDEG